MQRKTNAIMHVAYIFIILAVHHCHALSAASTAAAAAVPAGPAQAAVPAKASSDNKSPAAAAPRWLSTRGRHIIDAGTGERFKLRCGSWSGAQEAHYVPNGLWAQPASVIAQQVSACACSAGPTASKWHHMRLCVRPSHGADQFPARAEHRCTHHPHPPCACSQPTFRLHHLASIASGSFGASRLFWGATPASRLRQCQQKPSQPIPTSWAGECIFGAAVDVLPCVAAAPQRYADVGSDFV